MNTTALTLTKATILTAAVLATTSATADTLAESTFDTGTDGWAIHEITSNGQYVQAVSTNVLYWADTGGNPSGHVSASDTSTATIFLFAAPQKFLGNISEAYGGYFEFDLSCSYRNWNGDNVIVLVGRIQGSVRAIVATIDPLPFPAWTHYSIGLVARNFRYDNKQGTVVSNQDFQDVLTNLTALRISGDFGNGAVETTRLDNARLVTQPLLSIGTIAAVIVTGRIGTAYRLESVDTLGGTNWTVVTNLTLTTTPYIYYDYSSLGLPRRFFRTVELP